MSKQDLFDKIIQEMKSENRQEEQFKKVKELAEKEAESFKSLKEPGWNPPNLKPPSSEHTAPHGLKSSKIDSALYDEKDFKDAVKGYER